jgi:hypothetical protein
LRAGLVLHISICSAVSKSMYLHGVCYEEEEIQTAMVGSVDTQ